MMRLRFLTFRNVSENILVALSVNCVTRDAVRVKFTGFVHCPRYTDLVPSSLARCQANAVELATKVCFSLFDVDSEVV